MNENTAPAPAKSGLQFGVLFGVIMVLEFVLSYTLNIDPIENPLVGTIMNLLNYLFLPVIFITIACNNYKKANSGFISFGQCLKIGVTICLIAGLIFGLFSTVFGMIFPEYAEEIIRKTRAVMLEKNPQLTAEQVEMSLSWIRKFMNPLIAVPFTVVMFCFLGLVYSLIIGAIVKKDQPQSI